MRTTRRGARGAALAALAAQAALAGGLAGGLAGCKDVGLPENTPVEEARTRPPNPLVVATMPAAGPGARPAPVLHVAGGEWMATGVEYRLPEAYVRPVGSTEGVEAYTLAWDEEPYDRLLVRRAPGLYEEFAPLW